MVCSNLNLVGLLSLIAKQKPSTSSILWNCMCMQMHAMHIVSKVESLDLLYYIEPYPSLDPFLPPMIDCIIQS